MNTDTPELQEDIKHEIIFRDDMTVELVKSSASDADVIWAARVSTAGETTLEKIGVKRS